MQGVLLSHLSQSHNFQVLTDCYAGAPCVVERVSVPTPTGRNLLVKMKAASLCQTDLTIMSGKVGMDWFPLLPGHEVVCAVVQVPEEAALWGFKVGDLVGASFDWSVTLARVIASNIVLRPKPKAFT